MFQIKTKILYNQKVQGNYFHLIIEAAKIIKEARPGKFVDIRVNDGYEPLLRRPFSIHRVNRDYAIEILYEVVGKGTETLAQKKPGEYLDVIGPLGNGFTYHLPLTTYHLPILVAGGMGVAPLLFLAEKLGERKIKKSILRLCSGLMVSEVEPSKVKILVLIGAKTKGKILCEKEFKKLGFDVKIATDDGSKGFKGYVSDLLNHLLSTMNYEPSTIYACGPRPMLKEIAFISKRYNIPTQISLEEHMACGIGACLGCIVNTRQTFKRVCKDGPVFNADEIVW